MSQTKHERRQIKKRQTRAKMIRRNANIERNNPSTRFRLDVEVEGKWEVGVRYWRMRSDVESHKFHTEAMRKNGAAILHGRVLDTVRGVIVADIPASKAKGAAPDKIEDGVKAVPTLRGANAEPIMLDELAFVADEKKV